jgi:hypothetical protein
MGISMPAIGVGLGVMVGLGVTVGPNNCPGPQPKNNRLSKKWSKKSGSLWRIIMTSFFGLSENARYLFELS